MYKTKIFTSQQSTTEMRRLFDEAINEINDESGVIVQISSSENHWCILYKCGMVIVE